MTNYLHRSHLFGSNFDECSICLCKMYRVIVRSRCFGYNITLMACGHCFHSSCINDVLMKTNKCPICQCYNFSRKDQQILSHTKINNKDIEYILSINHDRAMVILKEAIILNNLELIDNLISKFDPIELVYFYISKSDAKSVSQLIKSKCLNCHKTFNNKTLLDAAIDSNNTEITQLIIDKLFPT